MAGNSASTPTFGYGVAYPIPSAAGAIYNLADNNVATQAGPALANTPAATVLENALLANASDESDYFQQALNGGSVSSSGGGNLIVANATGANAFAGGIVATANSQLGTLADNGGPTPTLALLLNSPAINAGVTGLGVSTDQRGVTRDIDPDIGAFEYVSPIPPVIPAANLVSIQSVESANYRLIYQGVAGNQYVLQQTHVLLPAVWIPVATNTAAPGDGTATFILPATTGTNTFWRVVH